MEKLYNEELNDLNSSPDVLLVMKSRRMSWAGHVARMRERRVLYRVLVGKPEGERDHLGDSGVDARIILIWILRKWDVGLWASLS
jgi:hypothetical protein